MKNSSKFLTFAVIAIIGLALFQLSQRFSENTHPPEESSITDDEKGNRSAPKKSINPEPTTSTERSKRELNAISRIHSEVDRTVAIEKWLENLNATTAPAMLTLVKELPSSPIRDQIMRQFFSKWGERDGPTAFAHAKNLSGRDHLRYLSSAGGGWAKSQPREAWQALMEVSNNGMMKTVNLTKATKNIAIEDPILAMELLESIDYPPARKARFARLLEAVSETGQYLPVLEKALLENDINIKEAYIAQLFRKWGEYELEAPLVALEMISDASVEDDALKGFLSGWARVDGSGAFAYVWENKDDEQIGKNLVTVAKEWAKNGTAEEVPLMLDSIPDSKEKEKIIFGIIRELGQANPETALTWAGALTNEKQRNRSIAGAMTRWARTDIEAAEHHYNSMSDGKEKSVASTSVILAKMEKGQDISTTLNSLSQLSNQKDKNSALNNISNAIKRYKSAFQNQQIEEFALSVYEMPGVSSSLKKRILENIGALDRYPIQADQTSQMGNSVKR